MYGCGRDPGLFLMLLQLTALWMEMGDGLEGLHLRLAAADALLALSHQGQVEVREAALGGC